MLLVATGFEVSDALECLVSTVPAAHLYPVSVVVLTPNGPGRGVHESFRPVVDVELIGIDVESVGKIAKARLGPQARDGGLCSGRIRVDTDDLDVVRAVRLLTGVLKQKQFLRHRPPA